MHKQQHHFTLYLVFALAELSIFIAPAVAPFGSFDLTFVSF